MDANEELRIITDDDSRVTKFRIAWFVNGHKGSVLGEDAIILKRTGYNLALEYDRSCYEANRTRGVRLDGAGYYWFSRREAGVALRHIEASLVKDEILDQIDSILI